VFNALQLLRSRFQLEPVITQIESILLSATSATL